MIHEIHVQCPDFRKIRTENLFYADKTKYIYQLLNGSIAKILCRPNGFGKTLMIDALEELFSGDRSLFSGLWIDSSDHRFEKRPVVRLNLGFDEPVDSDELMERINRALQEIVKEEGLPIGRVNPHLPFEDLIFNLYRKYNPRTGPGDPKNAGEDGDQAKVVVLIDDYDAPILKRLSDPAKALQIQKTLFGLYRSLHNLEKYCRLIFLTGQTNLGADCEGSNLSRLSDVSYLPEYAGALGFTMEETDRLLADQFEELAPALIAKNQFKPGQSMAKLKEAIAIWYDGYVFDGSTPFEEKDQDKIVRVLCPFTLLSFFAKKTFDNHWLYAQNFDFLSSIVAQKPERFIGDHLSGYSKLTLSNPKNPPMGPLLFQTGYLTLKEVSIAHGLMGYGFKTPNLEVSLGLRVAILGTLFNFTSIEEIQATQKKFHGYLTSHNQVDYEEAFGLAVARLTFRPPRPGDFFYRMVFQLFLYCLGFEIDQDDPTGYSRLELIQETFAATRKSEEL
jgi:hypothetical protein